MPPKFWFLGVRTPKRDGYHRDPQKAPPWPESHLHANFGTYRSTGYDLGVRRRNQKRKASKETYSGKLGVRPDYPR